MVTAIQAVSSVNTVSILPPVARVSVLTSEAGTSFVVPSTLVTLGASSAVTDPLTYNAAGLFGSLLQLNESNQATTNSTEPAAGGVTLNDLAALLGLDSDTLANTAAGLLDAPLNLQSLPASTIKALTTLLEQTVNDTTNDTNALAVNQALTSLLETALNTGATELEATPADSLMNAIDIIRALPPGSTAASIGALIFNAASDSSLLSPPPLLTPLTVPVAASNGTLEDIANPDTTVTPAVDAQLRAATDMTAEATAVEPALETLIARTATAAPATTTRAIAGVTTGNNAGLVTATSEITTGTATATATATTPAATATSAAAAAAATPQLHPAAQALNNISGNPAYAFAAAGMYLSAVISRMQPIAATTRPASAADAPQPVTPMRSIMPI